MRAKEHDETAAGLLADLHPLAEQAARILSYLSNVPESMSSSDQELAARIGHVSAQHISLVMRALVKAGLAARNGFSTQLVTSPESLTRFAQNLEKDFLPNKNFNQLIEKERTDSWKYGGRTVFGKAKAPANPQLKMF